MIKFNADIVDDLARRKVVLFLGAGVSASAKTASGNCIKQWGEFLHEATAHVSDNAIQKIVKRFIKEKKFLFASELLKQHLEERWGDILRNEFSILVEPSEMQRSIINLSQRIIITTNFDNTLEQTYTEINKKNIQSARQANIIHNIDSKVFRSLRDNENYIIKIHGDIQHIDSIVFDTSSYHDKAYGNTYYKEFLNSLLLTHTFLFIGFSMNDPAISLIIEMYAHRFPEARPHYIITSSRFTKQEISLWKLKRKMFVLTYNKKSNHSELTTSLQELCNLVKKRRGEILADDLNLRV